MYPTTVSAMEMEMPMHGAQCNSRNFPCKKKRRNAYFFRSSDDISSRGLIFFSAVPECIREQNQPHKLRSHAILLSNIDCEKRNGLTNHIKNCKEK